jgi:hypothetical protein
MVVDYKGEKVRLFFIRYNNAKNWTSLLKKNVIPSKTTGQLWITACRISLKEAKMEINDENPVK